MSYEQLKLGNQLCFPLYACAREVTGLYRPYLDALGITYTQYVVFLVLWEEKRMNVSELGRRLMLDSGTLTPLLKRLESKGYVTRRRGEDERERIIELTDEGLALREKAKEIPFAVGGCVKLEPDEATTLYRILYKILDSFKENGNV